MPFPAILSLCNCQKVYLPVEIAAHIMIEVKVIFDQLKACRGSI